MQTLELHPPIFDLHINPTYAVCIPQRSGRCGSKTLERLKNEANLMNNEHKGQMSKKATRRITNAVNWLVASAKNKWIFDKISNKRFTFRVNFITLTLPTLDHGVTDHEFKSVLLHNFINTCRYKYDLKNYVWKVETQANGNIHAHFTTDTFIHWKDIRTVWNRILQKKGVIDKYKAKHEQLTFEQYAALYDPTGTKDIQQIRNAFHQGCNSNWSDPNSTDVHSVHKVKDLASYLAKYMGKSDDDRRAVKGRLWGCSTNLSETNKLTMELADTKDFKVLEELHKAGIKYKPILSKPNAFGETFEIGSLFLYKLSDWGKNIKGKLLDLFNEHRFNIRYNINIEPPPPVELVTIPFISQGSSLPQNLQQNFGKQIQIF
jgi:predicted transcriptional regulator